MRTSIPNAALVTSGLLWWSVASAQPIIIIQPLNQTNLIGTTAMFSVTATGTAPLAYQWIRYTNPVVSGTIPGATNDTLVLVNVQPTTHRFAVVVSDAAGWVTSRLAQLTVLLAPIVTQQPSQLLANVGSTISNRVVATGTAPLAYQWRLNETDLPGRTSPDLVLMNVQFANAGNYTVVISNAIGSITSRLAGVTIVPQLSRSDVRAAITRDPPPSEAQMRIKWSTTPGKTYNVLTADRAGEAWIATNAGAIVATSTVSSFAERADRPMRLFRVREQAAPPGNTTPITTTTITETERILGLTFTDNERSQMLQILTSGGQDLNRVTFEAMRQLRLVNSDPPALIFNPVPRGFSFEPTQRPISWSPPRIVTLPTNPADLAFASVRDLGEWIRTRQITSTALTQFYLARLKRYDPNLLCVVTLTETLASEQAARADAEIEAGNYRGPLHGIPYGIKDLFSKSGYPTTWGAAPYQDQVIDEDATVVRKLEQAGAVLVAKLSMGALALGDVWFRGRTRNPWNTSQGSSGSSAGSASATAAGLVPFAIGTETWGSIVSPCTVCRVTGLRSTFGRVSRTGAMTLSWSMDKIGPICRTVEDCALVFEAIRGADGLDEAALNPPFNYDPALDLTRLRVGYTAGIPSAVTNRLAAIVGPERLVHFTLPNYPYNGMALIFVSVEPAAAFDELTRFGADALLTGQGTYDWPNLFRTARTVPAVEYLQADRLRKKLIQEMAALAQTVDLFVASEADEAALAISNLTGQPCVVIPHGGATSLSFIGKLYDEATVLALAKAYQDSTSFHTNRPPLFIQ